MNMKIVGISVAVLVSLVVLAGVLMPILDDATTTEDKFTNTGVYNMTGDPTGYVLDYRGTTTELYLGNTKICEFSDIPAGSWTLISTPDYLVRLQNYSAQSYALQLFGMDGTHTTLGNSSNESVKVTMTSSTIQVSTGDPLTYDGDFRGIAPTGDYVMTADGGFIVSDTDSIIVGNGATMVTNWYDIFYLSGTVTDMSVEASTGITTSNLSVNATPVDGYLNGSKVSSITFTATDGTNTVDATYNRVIVPHEVTLERAVHFTDNMNELLGVIPVLVIVSILLGVIALVIRSRLD